MAGGFHDIAINSVLLFRSVTETGGRSRNQRLTIRLDLGLRQRLGGVAVSVNLVIMDSPVFLTAVVTVMIRYHRSFHAVTQ
jgi:hypothetical protein